MSHVIGFVPPDDKWKQMKAVWDNCKALGIDPPTEVEGLFCGNEPSEHGMSIKIPHSIWSDDRRDGIEVNMKDIPPHVKVLRFIQTY
jgi:hypothetical protein